MRQINLIILLFGENKLSKCLLTNHNKKTKVVLIYIKVWVVGV